MAELNEFNEHQARVDQAVESGDTESVNQFLKWARESSNPWQFVLKYPHLVKGLLHEGVPVQDPPNSILVQMMILGPECHPEYIDTMRLLMPAGLSFESPHACFPLLWMAKKSDTSSALAMVVVEYNPRLALKFEPCTWVGYHPEAIEYALEHGVKLEEFVDREDKHWAFSCEFRNELPTLALFLRHGLDPNLSHNNTTLLQSVSSVDCARLLIEHGADYRITNKVGQNLAHTATARYHLFRYFVEECRIDPFARDQHNRNAINMIIQQLNRNCDLPSEYDQTLSVLEYLLYVGSEHLASDHSSPTQEKACLICFSNQEAESVTSRVKNMETKIRET